MPDSYPYIVSNNKIEPILARIRTAARPERLGRETLAKWGFTASNDRAMTTVLKELGFLNEGSVPTAIYDRLRDSTDWKYVLGERMRELYSDLFAIDGSINMADETEVKGAMSRVTGKDDETVKRYYATFRTLASLANFEPKPSKVGMPRKEEPKTTEKEAMVQQPMPLVQSHEQHGQRKHAQFHYNLQIILPATTDIAVYNAIFKSIKEHLGI